MELTEFVPRPGLGKAGQPVKVRTNFFPVISFPERIIYHYDLNIEPDVPPIINRKVWKHFEELNLSGALEGIRSIYEGRKNVFTPKEWPFEAKQFEASNLIMGLGHDSGI
ncbi:hypothetical protein BZG36_04505 [Bifiguratus adelaidae]|uniref:Protein argonaute N-terminal domain-containing protein n=1 Tax=Bifiguratus adelaidae TaxID=1938954 RepID=A0A261XW04_9FUNG|nr:hypothetical protein BZG36_04505 [Bifiguratus adelaidae]